LEDLFLLRCLRSKACGSARKNTTNLDRRSSTANVFKLLVTMFGPLRGFDRNNVMIAIENIGKCVIGVCIGTR